MKAKDEKAEPIPKRISSSKVWSRPNTYNSGTPSPNGKFSSYMDQETGNVAMREFSTGKTSLLTKEGTWENPMKFTIGSIVSPNSKQVAYSWYNVKSNSVSIHPDGQRIIITTFNQESEIWRVDNLLSSEDNENN